MELGECYVSPASFTYNINSFETFMVELQLLLQSLASLKWGPLAELMHAPVRSKPSDYGLEVKLPRAIRSSG